MDDTTVSGNEDGDEEDAELCEDEESGAKRNSGPDAEFVAFSPHSLMATNRFWCEVYNRGFQREQNLQFHRRGHNWPRKLKQKTNDEFKKTVYIFPEVGCVHHDPSRALGDLTTIKKHFSGKHSGKKKFGCDKCKKKFAVLGDWCWF
ncbi:protein indeterminate-domain 13-like [Apium graveolens]|uniref:protein indeterminate-domain 13-like n=1 Tax=Apium graveolens TaxID=4045 RepID=UPI003D7BB5BA